jgi:site-specific DNA-methyltransferase (cytosine-N4-specific)
VQWASKTRQQLNVAYEPVLWFSPDPLRCFADNRRVLQPHTDKHLKLVAGGGERRSAVYGDGAYRQREGRSFSTATAGRIPRNVLQFTHHGAEISQLRAQARALGLPVHGALMPLALATFLIKFLTREGDLVADCFGGWGTTAAAAEASNRRWILTELMAEYVAGQALRLARAPGFECAIPAGTFSAIG